MPKIPSLSADEMRTLRGTAEAAQRARMKGPSGMPGMSPRGSRGMAPPTGGMAPGAMRPALAPGMKSGGSVSSRADGIASKGKTRGKIC
jgi:hypothetical protein